MRRADDGQTMAMKGWRRIGIILSVIWFLGFGVYLWHEAEENNLRPLNARWDSCLLTFRMAEHDLDESVRGRGPTEEWAKKWFAISEQRNKCEANAKLEWESTRSYSTQLASERDCVYFLAEESPQGSLARRAKHRGGCRSLHPQRSADDRAGMDRAADDAGSEAASGARGQSLGYSLGYCC